MDTCRLTIAKIKELLQQPIVEEDLLQQLAQDERKTVARLLGNWFKAQEQRNQEQQRIAQLYSYERKFATQGFELVAGIDEAGRGPLAGPVVVASVILPIGCFLSNLNDSKKLSAKQRSELYELIIDRAIAVNVVVIEPEEIDAQNIYQATVSGMYQAINEMTVSPQAVLVDAVPLPKLGMPSASIIGGDGLSASIGAASIIAKVTRDNIMEEFHGKYPQYGFAKHKGYGTAEHLRAIAQHGPCPIHRRSFEPIKSLGG